MSFRQFLSTLVPVILRAGSYAVQVMLLIFLSIGTLLITCFFGYHCSLIVKGMTSYETFKWQDYKDHCMEVAQDARCCFLLTSERIVSNILATSLTCVALLKLWTNLLLELIHAISVGQPRFSSRGSCGHDGLGTRLSDSRERH